MEERGYVVEALLERLRIDGIAFRLIGDASGFPESAPAEIDLAVAPESLPRVPTLAAAFAQEFDLRLVELERPARRAWRAVLAWSDEVGRPRFLAARFFVAAEQGTSADALFIAGLVDAVERRSLAEERGAWLANLFKEEPQAATERIAHFWRDERQAGLVAQAARAGNWTALRSHFAQLSRGLRRFRLPDWPGSRPTVLFTGREVAQRANLMTHVQGRLAPLALDMFEDRAGNARGADFRVVYDGPQALDHPDAVVVRANDSLTAMIGAVEAAILRWLECRVERRYPEAVVGPNPRTARLLQTPGIGALVGWLAGCRIECRLGSPVLMPVPMGIVIERGVRLGSRVTVMHQVTIGRKNPVGLRGQGGEMPVIEDNVFIGAGAKVLGPVRIGRGAIVGANAVVTRDVPSHCTVVGVNRILGIEAPAVAARRREEERTVVNT
ncbi:MAG TPA: serine acetyltransferase [Burkholderiales bacterium]|nr:serine acetyltransferase [Burkholderiales bacterium]